jgi:hypothetical protein
MDHTSISAGEIEVIFFTSSWLSKKCTYGEAYIASRESYGVLYTLPYW